MSGKCVAIEWKLTEQGKDYVACSSDESLRLCRLEGLMLAFDVHLCLAHQRYFLGRPPGWGTVQVFDVASGRRLDRDYSGKVYLTAEKWRGVQVEKKEPTHD